MYTPLHHKLSQLNVHTLVKHGPGDLLGQNLQLGVRLVVEGVIHQHVCCFAEVLYHLIVRLVEGKETVYCYKLVNLIRVRRRVDT